MNLIPPVEYIFIAIGIIFLIVAIRDYIKSDKKWSIAAKIRMRMAIIFTVVGIGLYILHHFILK